MIGIREYNKKIASLKNTKKMTKTMKMVSASKFKRAFKAQSTALAYARELTGLMNRLGSLSVDTTHPLMTKPKTVSKVLVLVLTSDKGLCGGFNNNLIRFVRSWAAEHASKYASVQFSFAGKKGMIALRKSVTVLKYYENVTARPSFAHAMEIGGDLAQAYIARQFDEIYIAYNHFNTPMSQTPVMERLLPCDSSEIKGESEKTTQSNYEFEPDPEELYKFLVPKYINFKIYFTLLENSAGEHGARMTAMDKATENTGVLIDQYILRRNRARQSAITTELIEIISGAEALNG